MTFCFPKSIRLLYPSQYRRVHAQAKRLAGEYLYIDIIPNIKGHTKMGISISRKFGKSVQRNRFKRCLREAFRLNYSSLPQGYDFVVRPRKLKVEVSTEILSGELKSLLTNI